VLGIASGWVELQFGGPNGRAIRAQAGDVIVIPAGVAHCNLTQSADLLVVGAYPGGSDYDICHPADHARALKAIAAVPLPNRDPIYGAESPPGEQSLGFSLTGRLS
jgi:uncharacterized protein YjlB